MSIAHVQTREHIQNNYSFCILVKLLQNFNDLECTSHLGALFLS